jgi:hypothetical protein
MQVQKAAADSRDRLSELPNDVLLRILERDLLPLQANAEPAYSALADRHSSQRSQLGSNEWCFG